MEETESAHRGGPKHERSLSLPFPRPSPGGVSELPSPTEVPDPTYGPRRSQERRQRGVAAAAQGRSPRKQRAGGRRPGSHLRSERQVGCAGWFRPGPRLPASQRRAREAGARMSCNKPRVTSHQIPGSQKALRVRQNSQARPSTRLAISPVWGPGSGVSVPGRQGAPLGGGPSPPCPRAASYLKPGNSGVRGDVCIPSSLAWIRPPALKSSRVGDISSLSHPQIPSHFQARQRAGSCRKEKGKAIAFPYGTNFFKFGTYFRLPRTMIWDGAFRDICEKRRC